MKLMRKILSLVLVVALAAIFAVPVFAYGYTYYHTYNGSEVETNGQCGGNSYLASTNTMATNFLVQTDVKVYYYDYDGGTEDPTIRSYRVYGQENVCASRVSGEGDMIIQRIVTYHYAGGNEIYSQNVYPSE